jgi:uncharacterized protein with PIN domain
MLNRLGRWLRAAGYDTVIARAGIADRELLKRARAENRILVTRDRKLLEHKHADKAVILLANNSVHDCALELAGRLPVDWLYRPFSRCLDCNTPLIPATREQIDSIPEDARQHGDHISYCPACNKTYWPGSHFKRMHTHLRHWQQQAGRRP